MSLAEWTRVGPGSSVVSGSALDSGERKGGEEISLGLVIAYGWARAGRLQDGQCGVWREPVQVTRVLSGSVFMDLLGGSEIVLGSVLRDSLAAIVCLSWCRKSRFVWVLPLVSVGRPG